MADLVRDDVGNERTDTHRVPKPSQPAIGAGRQAKSTVVVGVLAIGAPDRVDFRQECVPSLYRREVLFGGVRLEDADGVSRPHGQHVLDVDDARRIGGEPLSPFENGGVGARAQQHGNDGEPERVGVEGPIVVNPGGSVVPVQNLVLGVEVHLNGTHPVRQAAVRLHQVRRDEHVEAPFEGIVHRCGVPVPVHMGRRVHGERVFVDDGDGAEVQVIFPVGVRPDAEQHAVALHEGCMGRLVVTRIDDGHAHGVGGGIHDDSGCGRGSSPPRQYDRESVAHGPDPSATRVTHDGGVRNEPVHRSGVHPFTIDRHGRPEKFGFGPDEKGGRWREGDSDGLVRRKPASRHPWPERAGRAEPPWASRRSEARRGAEGEGQNKPGASHLL